MPGNIRVSDYMNMHQQYRYILEDGDVEKNVVEIYDDQSAFGRRKYAVETRGFLSMFLCAAFQGRHQTDSAGNSRFFSYLQLLPHESPVLLHLHVFICWVLLRVVFPVLEAVDLPETFSVADGSLKGVTARVTLGTRQFETESRVASEGRIDSWNSDFVFLVTNLRDKLVVAICDNDDQCLTQTSIEVPSIIERGFRDEFVELKRGGRIHLNMSFFLTDDERRKIRAMRLHVLKRREERLQRSIVFQNIQPINENELKTAPVSAVTIADLSDSITHEQGVLQETVIGPLHIGSTTKPLGPTVMFNYVRAVGMQSGRPCQRTEKSSKYRAADIEHEVPAYDYEGDQCKLEDLRISSWNELEDEGTTCVGLKNQTRIRDRQQAIQAGRTLMDVSRSNPSVQSGQVQMLEARSGPGARWPQKSGLDNRWTCREKARQIDRFEWNGQVSDQMRARAKILELIKAASGSRQGCADDRRLEERQSLKDNIGVVLHKVAGGAAILLVSLLMMWTTPKGSEHGYEGTIEDDAGS